MAKSQANAKQHPEAEFLLFENYSHSPSTLSSKNNRTYVHILHPHYHPKIKGHILENKQNNKGVYIREIIRSIIMIMKKKMKNTSHRYNINRPRPRHEHKYSKRKKCLSMMILIFIKQHLSNI